MRTERRESCQAMLLAILAAIAVVTTPLRAQDSRIHGEYSQTLQVDGRVTLEVQNLDGGITVRAGPEGEVYVHGTISAGTKFDCDGELSKWKAKRFEENFPLERAGNRIRVGYGPDYESPRCIEIQYNLQVPLGTALVIEQNHGDLVVRDVGGPVQIEKKAGNVRVTGAGDVVKANVGAGNILVEGEPRAEWNLELGTGRVRIRLPKDTGFVLDAKTRDGRIDSEFPTTSGIQSERMNRTRKKELRGSVNGGGPRIRIRTSMGGIDIWAR